MHKRQIATFYKDEQVCHSLAEKSFSKSPLKPKLVIDRIKELGAEHLLEMYDFSPFDREEFLIAHTEKYVEAFFAGDKRYCETNGIPWSSEFAKSVTYTNSSLYHAQRHAMLNPEQVSFSPTSGFHHAQPDNGVGFCTFSGQVIAAVKLYRELGVRGACFDLDAHWGNSRFDSERFVPDILEALPGRCYIDPDGKGDDYLHDLEKGISYVQQQLLNNEIQWIVFAHGADSHVADDIRGGQLTTEQWFQASRMVYQGIADVETQLGRPVPVTISLFGGYRKDDYQSVIDLHVGDFLICAEILLGSKLRFDY